MVNNRDIIDYLHNLPAFFSNRLVDPKPQRLNYSCRVLVLVGLMLVCMVPRVLFALRLASICPDGILYIGLAEALKEGRYHQAFEIMNLNIYPVVLMILNRLGLSWEMGGTVWGVVVSCLVVLPLFGWVRRQFDDAVALTACLLYAVQPVFIQWSPEIIRDPTFWFFYILAMYLLWRSVIEVRIGLSLAAGLAVTLAILTRFEGLLLLIPLGLWAFWRYRALSSGHDRAKLAFGSILTVTAFPALILFVNFTFLRHHSQWVSTRLYPLSLIGYWWNGLSLPSPVDAAGDNLHSLSYVPFGRMVAIYVPTLVKGLSPLFALFMLGGMWGWRHVWARRDHQPLFYSGLAIMSAAWIHAWCAKGSCDRYFLPMVILGSSFAALGFLGFTARLLHIAERLKSNATLRHAAVFAPLIIIASVGYYAAFSSPYERRGAEVELGNWVRRQYGPSAMIFGSEGVTPVVAHYAKANWATLAIVMDDATVLKQVENLKPDVILLCAKRRKELLETKQLVAKIEKMEYTEIDRSDLPHGTDDVLMVLSRGDVQPPVYIETGVKTISRK
jgi:Dolichyl-phosphate-mannose-protein mannosyltransferase